MPERDLNFKMDGKYLTQFLQLISSFQWRTMQRLGISNLKYGNILVFMLVIMFLLHSLLTSTGDEPAEWFSEVPAYTLEEYSLPNGSFITSRKLICPIYTPLLVGVENVDAQSDLNVRDIIKHHEDLQPGGSHKPSTCVSNNRLAVIIPYRDRWHHLRLLLDRLHTMLKRQQADYTIIVVEQAYQGVFNKGRIMNIAFDIMSKHRHFDCFVFHDVDLLPENDRNLYRCGVMPRHLSPAVDEMRYVLMYKNLAGGVLAVTEDHFRRANGYSNLYWGWGAEDDDMAHRIMGAGFTISRPAAYVGRYKMVRHPKRTRATQRYQLLDYWQRYPHEGVNSLRTLNYTVLSVTKAPLYTNITVDVGVQTDGEYRDAIKDVKKGDWGWN